MGVTTETAGADRFRYAEMTRRNVGFVTAEEQEALRAARVFVCGVGGMGGAAVDVLVRAGVGGVVLADPDRFEPSNLNRQRFASLDTMGAAKTGAARRALLRVTPELEVETWGGDWVGAVDGILRRCQIVVNGMDDVRCGILLYRKAREHGASVVDAYTSPLPSVTVVRPGDPRPEERLGFPTRGVPWSRITGEMLAGCSSREIEYVLVHSSSLDHLDPEVARGVAAGTRARPSFAPVVDLAGALLALEALNLLLGREGTDHRGYFLNPWTGRTERPRHPAAAWILRRLARRRLARWTDAG